jgi:hypothetical protein
MRLLMGKTWILPVWLKKVSNQETISLEKKTRDKRAGQWKRRDKALKHVAGIERLVR